MNKKILIVILLGLNFITKIKSQNNLIYWSEKYWIYRERLKNFIYIPENNTVMYYGNSLPANKRGGSLIAWEDAPIMLGIWIGTLAMEYYILTQSNAPYEYIEQNLKELYFAIEAINRLDDRAEIFYGCSDSYPNRKNGFLVADDVPIVWQNKPYVDFFTSSYVPLPNTPYYNISCVSSAITDYSPAREASKDHWTALLLGFMLVKRFIPHYLDAPYTFSSGNKKYIKEIQNITNRFIMHITIKRNKNCIKCFHYFLWNLCKDHCVKGVSNLINFSACCCSITNECKQQEGSCDKGGAVCDYALLPLLKINNIIQMPDGYIDNVFYLTEYFFNKPSRFAYIYTGWRNYFRLFPKEWIPNFLSAISNTGTITMSKNNLTKLLWNRSQNNNYQATALLHYLLHYSSNEHMPDIEEKFDEYFTCLLNAAPCFGHNEENQRTIEWSDKNRVLGERSKAWGDAFNGIPYLFFYNAFLCYKIIFKNFTDYTLIKPIPITHLTKENYYISSPYPNSDYYEYYERHYIAANEIKAGSISNNGRYFISPYSSYKNTVTFSAGHSINLLPGFNVSKNTFFEASIDTGIKAAKCPDYQPSESNCSGLSKSFTEITENYIDTIRISEETIIVIFLDSICIYLNNSALYCTSNDSLFEDEIFLSYLTLLYEDEENTENVEKSFNFNNILNNEINNSYIYEIKVYPGLFSDYFIIYVNPPLNYNIEIFNSLGNKIKCFKIDKENFVYISGQGLEKDVYFVKIYSDKINETKIVVKI